MNHKLQLLKNSPCVFSLFIRSCCLICKKATFLYNPSYVVTSRWMVLIQTFLAVLLAHLISNCSAQQYVSHKVQLGLEWTWSFYSAQKVQWGRAVGAFPHLDLLVQGPDAVTIPLPKLPWANSLFSANTSCDTSYTKEYREEIGTCSLSISKGLMQQSHSFLFTEAQSHMEPPSHILALL